MKTIAGIFVSVFVLGIFVVVAVKFGLLNSLFGNGVGDGRGLISGSSTISEVPSKSDLSEENKTSKIRIEGNDIYFDDELIKDVDDLKQKITDIDIEREYTFVYDNSIKSTYDKVNEALSELESALGITVIRK